MIQFPVKKRKAKVCRYYVCFRAQAAGTDTCPSGLVNAERFAAAVIQKPGVIATWLDHSSAGQRIERALTVLSSAADAKRKIGALDEVVEKVIYDHASKRLGIGVRDDSAEPTPMRGEGAEPEDRGWPGLRCMRVIREDLANSRPKRRSTLVE